MPRKRVGISMRCFARREVSSSLDKDKRSELGQYFTPQPIAGFMASLFGLKGKGTINIILDAGQLDEIRHFKLANSETSPTFILLSNQNKSYDRISPYYCQSRRE